MKCMIAVALACAVAGAAVAMPYGSGYGGSYNGLPVSGVPLPGVGTSLASAPAINPVPIVPVAPPVPIPVAPIQPAMPGLGGNRGKTYVNQGYQKSNSGTSGNGFQNQASNAFYDQGQDRSKIKTVFESDNSSSRNRGGSNQASNSGQSGSSYSSYDQGGINTGNEYQQGYGYPYLY